MRNHNFYFIEIFTTIVGIMNCSMTEFIGSIFAFYLIFAVIAAIIIKSKKRNGRDGTEIWVEGQLKRLLSQEGYIVFGDLIIPSVSKNISSTQIDHVIISPYGIFCLETKSHQGNIYGGYKSLYWKQYLGNKKYELYNPIRQNSHHVKSLEYLLRSRLKSPIHSYIVFPSARRIKINGNEIDLTLRCTVDRILNHKRQVYTHDDVEAMAKGLAYVSSRSSDFRDGHIEAVQEFIASRNK